MMHHSELDLQRGGTSPRKALTWPGVLFGQIKICTAMRQRRVTELHAVGPVHGHQDGCQMLAHDDRKVVLMTQIATSFASPSLSNCATSSKDRVF
ncbi:hypothetical protein [Mesorhizobium sp.]|uniref:hypothetical protein n=1 Tax=Mesorhizobium sp. TaxID=1871066 RepID=UPI00257E821D|nr:hypothetical protein [Mesorhizobium sp.]